MKKTKRNYIFTAVVVLVLTMLLSVTAFAATNEECTCGGTPTTEIGEVIAPTCTTEGYTEMICTQCGKLAGITDVKAAYDHEFTSAPEYIAIDGDEENGFYETTKCANCDVYKITTVGGADTSNRVFYKVEFINPFQVDTTDDTIKTTLLAATHKEEVLSTVYIEKDTTAEEEAASVKIPVRMKDKAYGEYKSAGWTTEKQDYAEGVVTVDVASYVITENTKFYAYYKGIQIYHSVCFFDENGLLISETTAPHGQGVDTTDIEKKAVKAEDYQYVYTFARWSEETDAIYCEMSLFPLYNKKPQEYKFTAPGLLQNSDGSWYYDEGSIVCDLNTVTLTYGQQNADNSFAYITDIAKEKDAQYTYKWTGKWVLKNYPSYEIDMKGTLKLPASTSPSIKLIEIMPKFESYARVYQLQVLIGFNDDTTTTADDYNRQYASYFYSEGSKRPLVSITNSAGFVSSGYADYNADKNCFVYTCNVKYSSSLTVTATTYDNMFTGTQNILYWTSGEEDGMTQVSMGLNYQQPKDCGCICHNSVFKSIWATILNIIYNLFGKKVVCCDHMYSTIGEMLAYAQF